MVSEVTLEFELGVEAGDVTMSVEIGDGQVGGSVLTLDGQQIGPVGAVKKISLGDGLALVGKQLLVRTLVSDISSVTNWTSVTYRLGKNPPIRAKKEVATDKDAVRYNTTFTFVPAK